MQEYQLQHPHSFKILSSYMPESFELDAINTALIAVDKYKQLKDVALYIKQEYDKKYPGSGKASEGVYHCIVGKSFASECLLCALFAASDAQFGKQPLSSA